MSGLGAILYLVFGPLAGGFLAGLDRRINARMQGRVGPPLWQPFADVLKLLEKENLVIRRSQNLYVMFFGVVAVFSGALFFAGGDLLLVIFALTLAGVFFVLAGYKATSPYSFLGAERELLQMMAYEPALILTAVGLYMVTGSFSVGDIVSSGRPLWLLLPGIFLSLLFSLLIKFRKSPFDLSTSHHAHQELVKGVTTEFSARTLAVIEVAHWYEHVFALGLVFLFFPRHPVAGAVACLASYFVMILVDNACARVKWQWMISGAWIAALVLGVCNVMILFACR